MEQTQDIEALRGNFLAVCAMWELQITVNNQLVAFVSKSEEIGGWQEKSEVIESQFSELKEKVEQMKGATQKVEARLRSQLKQKENELEAVRSAHSSEIQNIAQREIDTARVLELSKRVANLQQEVAETARLRTENASLKARVRELSARRRTHTRPPTGNEDPMLTRFSELESEIDALYDAVCSSL
jgi:DNA repair exonuclease SbcCD ATPase subunit